MTSHYPRSMWERQALATLNQAAPVQNTYYDILPVTTDVRVYDLGLNVEDTNETIGDRLTVDGVVITGTIAATHSTKYESSIRSDPINRGMFMEINGGANWEPYRAFITEGKSVQYEFRKTTAAGVGNLTGVVNYSRKPE